MAGTSTPVDKFLSFGAFGLSEQIDYHLYRRETNMRMSFDELCGMVKNKLGSFVSENEPYVFINNHHILIKLLVHNCNGFTLMYHRLDNGTLATLSFDLDVALCNFG